jgi:toxin CcdB
MAQFDVHRNTGRQKESIPFVVVVQSTLFEDYRRRVVIPLVRANAIGAIQFRSFNPTFIVKGLKVVLHPLEVVSVPADQLGAKVGSLADSGQEIVAALDVLFSSAWK